MNDLIGAAVVTSTLADGTEVLAVTVEPGTAPEAWAALRDRHAATGLWPFLVEPKAPTLLGRLPLPDSAREHHRGAAEIFARHAEFGVRPFTDDLDVSGEPRTDHVSAVADTTTIALVPAEWGGVEIPGLLGWDGAPALSGLEHTAVLADWHRRFGAQLMTLTGDRIELCVPRPPATPEAVRTVTLEQAGYCPEILSQRWKNVVELAERHTNSRLWCFHWSNA